VGGGDVAQSVLVVGEDGEEDGINTTLSRRCDVGRGNRGLRVIEKYNRIGPGGI
jgi:hypothetical protein